jgi:hypothetical protein
MAARGSATLTVPERPKRLHSFLLLAPARDVYDNLGNGRCSRRDSSTFWLSLRRYGGSPVSDQIGSRARSPTGLAAGRNTIQQGHEVFVGGSQPLVYNFRGKPATMTTVQTFDGHRALEPGGKQSTEHEFMVNLPLARNRKVAVTAQPQVILDAHGMDMRRQVGQIGVGIDPFVVGDISGVPADLQARRSDPLDDLHAIPGTGRN